MFGRAFTVPYLHILFTTNQCLPESCEQITSFRDLARMGKIGLTGFNKSDRWANTATSWINATSYVQAGLKNNS